MNYTKQLQDIANLVSMYMYVNHGKKHTVFT